MRHILKITVLSSKKNRSSSFPVVLLETQEQIKEYKNAIIDLSTSRWSAPRRRMKIWPRCRPSCWTRPRAVRSRTRTASRTSRRCTRRKRRRTSRWAPSTPSWRTSSKANRGKCWTPTSEDVVERWNVRNKVNLVGLIAWWNRPQSRRIQRLQVRLWKTGQPPIHPT